MPFSPWQPPEEALAVEHTREQNRLQSLTESASASRIVINDIEVNLHHLARRIRELVRQARKLVDASVLLTRA